MGFLKELVLATVKSNVRERLVFFWVLIFPLMMYIMFGVFLQGEDRSRAAVYISSSSAAERFAEWLRWYSITAEVVEGLDDPINFLVKQAAVGRAAVYLATDGNVAIYSTSVYGPMAAGLVEGALYFQQFGELSNITMNIPYVEGGVMRNVTYKIDVVAANVSAISVFSNGTHILITIPRWSPQFGGGVHYVDLSTGISGSVEVTWLVRMGLAMGVYLMLTVAFTMYSLHVAGCLKRLYLSPKGR